MTKVTKDNLLSTALVIGMIFIALMFSVTSWKITRAWHWKFSYKAVVHEMVIEEVKSLQVRIGDLEKQVEELQKELAI